LFYSANLYHLRREVEATQKQTEALITLCQEQGSVMWEAPGITLRGWALAKQGRQEEGIAHIRRGLADIQATGQELWRSQFLTHLAEAFGEAGQPEEGLRALTEAFDQASKTHEHLFEAELYRLKGELLLMRDESSGAQAESCFQRAIEVARKQSAKAWELRATISLARLLARQGRRDQARSMLAEIYGWFTEGFDTADLKEARVLLDELA
jgi:predicted ATPase